MSDHSNTAQGDPIKSPNGSASPRVPGAELALSFGALAFALGASVAPNLTDFRRGLVCADSVWASRKFANPIISRNGIMNFKFGLFSRRSECAI